MIFGFLMSSFLPISATMDILCALASRVFVGL
jgi:hypothetical protein